MSQSKDAPEPSMEEILSSIRRIIADEEKDRPAGGAAGAASSAGSEDDDVLELTDLADAEPEEPAPASIAPLPAAVALTAPPAVPNDPFKEKATVAASKDDSLVSVGAASASTNAFSKLTRAVTVEDRPASPVAGRSVEDLMTELLRPLLKDWLDQNLAAVVERVVEQEVKKLARRAELL